MDQTRRGNRLAPSRFSRLYWHLTCLRREYVAICQRHLSGRPSQTLIDYGCGNMPYRPVFEPSVARYLGADLRENDLADIVVSPEGVLAMEDESCDVVLSSQVLEHVPSPELYLGEAQRVLRDGGLLLLSTHGVWRYHPDPTDFWRWTCDGLRKTVADSGLEVLEMRGIHGPPAYGLQTLQDVYARLIPRPLRPLFYFPVQLAMQLSDALYPERLRAQDASVFVVVAQKVSGVPTENPKQIL